jgi:ATP phosphoribosyltransferase
MSGLHIINGKDRQLIAKTSDPHLEILFARPIDIPGYVENGAADLGITGRDMVSERHSHVVELLDLKIGIARMVLAVPEGSDITSISDLKGARVATAFPTIASEYFHEHGIPISLVPVSGACEATPHLGIADAIVDLTSSGTTLQTHHLKVLTEIFKTSSVLIANHESMEKSVIKLTKLPSHSRVS